MTDQTKDCPQATVLLSFLQGKLHPPQLDQCESHLKDCPLCHETLVGLSGNDTLSERIVEALDFDSTDSPENEMRPDGTDSVEINNLLNRLNSDDFKRDAMRYHPNKHDYKGLGDSEVIADRAAEVLRCLTPEAESLGVLGDYTLQRLIGAGSTGVVFQALDQKLDRTVALKVLRPSLGETARQRFLVEAKLAASIEHVNVVTIFQVGQVERLAYIAMPWLPGRTLESLLATGEQLEKDRIIEIIKQVAAGLQAAHKQQLVHRDIKPANLWICEEDNQLKILDFGLARISDDDPNLTATGMLAGTPNFMSPEQTRGLELDGRSDLFSLGCVLYRLLTGKLPFGAPTVLATLSSIQNDHPIPPSGLDPKVSKDLSDLTMCLLEKQPATRPQSAMQTIELLTAPRSQWAIAVNEYPNPLEKSTTSGQQFATSATTSNAGRGKGRNGAGWFRAGVVAVALALLGTFGWLFAPQLIRIATDQGEVVIETKDENVEVQVLQDGKVVRVIDTNTQQSFDLKSGKYSFNAVASNDEEAGENSITIKPDSLIIRRGEKAIVKVAVNAKIQSNEESLVSNLEGNNSLGSPDLQSGLLNDMNREKPVYQGHPFSHWFKTAKLDRDPKTQADALQACASTAETNDEWEPLMVLTRQVAREYGALLIDRNNTSPTYNQYQIAMTKVLDRCDLDLVFQFFKTEIADGNLKSRRFCLRWLLTQDNGYLLYERVPLDRKRKVAIQDRILELDEVLANNFQSPFVPKLLNYLLPVENSAQRVFEMRQKSKVGAKLKNKILSGNLQERFELLEAAINLLGDDEEVFQIYQNHLLDPRINDLKSLISSHVPKSRVRARIFSAMTNFLFPLEISPGDRAIAPKTSEKRNKTGVELLLAVTDAIMADGDDHLRFQVSSSGFVGPGGGIRKILNDIMFCNDLLPVFLRAGKELDSQDQKQQLAEKLKELRRWIGMELREEDLDRFSRLFPKLDHVISFLEDADASDEPNLSLIREPLPVNQQGLEKVTSGGNVNDPAPAAVESLLPSSVPKPFYNGKTFAQWLETAKFDRATRTQTEAIRACAATAEDEQEWLALMKLTQKLAREYGSNTTGLNANSDLYQSALLRVLKKCEVNLVLEFFKQEIADGNYESRMFCRKWMNHFSNGYPQSPNIRRERQRRSEIQNRVLELEEVLAGNLNSPGVVELVSCLLPEGDEADKIFQKLEGSSLWEKLKNKILTSNLQQRYELLSLALKLLGDDEDVFQSYRKELLSLSLNDIRLNNYFGQISGPRVRTELFFALTELSFPSVNHSDSLNVSMEIAEKRRRAGAELLLAVSDLFIAEGEDRIKFERPNFNGGGGGGFGGGGGLGGVAMGVNISPIEFAQDILPLYYAAGKVLNDEDLKQKLQAKLAEMKDQLFDQNYSTETYRTELDNLKYLIDFFKSKDLVGEPDPSLLRTPGYPSSSQGGGVF